MSVINFIPSFGTLNVFIDTKPYLSGLSVSNLSPSGDNLSVTITNPFNTYNLPLAGNTIQANGTTLSGTATAMVIQIKELIAQLSAVKTPQLYTAGATLTVTDQATDIWLIINPASVVASLAITLPAAPGDNQKVEISFGGTIAGAAAVVTTLSIAANSGQTLMQSAAPVTANGGDCIMYRYRAATTQWYRLK